MNIEILAGKSRGYACAECFQWTAKGSDGYHLIVHKTNVPFVSVNEDLHRACGDAVIARADSARDSMSTVRLCVHCGKECIARCATKECGHPCCFRGTCIEKHAMACAGYAKSRAL